MKIIRHFNPGEIITLFDVHSDKKFEGVLYFDSGLGIGIPFFRLSGLKIWAYLCLFIAILGFFSFVYPIVREEINARFTPSISSVATKVKVFDPSIYKYLVNPQTIPIQSTEFKLIIPKINLESDVVPEVDPSKEDEYKNQLLAGGIAHAKGSYLPGENGPILLFSHSTNSLWNVKQFNAKFYQLKALEIGDEVDIVYHGKFYGYIVNSKQILNGTDVDIIRNSSSNLILQTCWPPGTDWQRLIVFAKSVY